MASRRSSGLWEQQSQSQSQSEGQGQSQSQSEGRSEGRSARERVEEARGGDGGKQLVLFVTVVSARGLAAASSSSLASSLLAKAAHGTRDEGKGMIKSTHSVNPYVRLSYGDSKQQTSVTRGSLLPLWNESFIFPFEEFANFKLTVYNKVAFGRDEVVGESYLQTPSPQKPVARWCSLKTRSRTVLDLGRRMVESRGGDDCIGQVFVAALLLDPLELTLIGQGLMDLPQAGCIDSTVESISLVGELETTETGYKNTPKIRVDLADAFRRSNFNNTVGAFQLFWTFCAMRKKRLMQAYGLWKFKIEMMRREEVDSGNSVNSDFTEPQSARRQQEFQSMKKQCMEARFFARASQHKIKALETKLNSVHNDKYLKEVAVVRAETDLGRELSAAILRAELAESVVKRMEGDMMGIPDSTMTYYELRPPAPPLHPFTATSSRRSSRRLSGGSDVHVTLKESRRRTACLQFFLCSAFRKQHVYQRLVHTFYRWKYNQACSFDDDRQVKNMAEYEDRTVDTAARIILDVAGEEVKSEIQLQAEVESLRCQISSQNVKILFATFSRWLRSCNMRRLLLAWKRWNSILVRTSRSHHKKIKDGGNQVSESLLFEAEKKFNELKKKSDTYQASVKAHWAKTELYMTKLKDMLSEEKQKRKVLKEEKGALSVELNALQIELEVAKRDINELKSETVKNMIHVQKSLTGVVDEANRASGSTRISRNVLNIDSSPVKEGSPSERSRSFDYSCSIEPPISPNRLSIPRSFRHSGAPPQISESQPPSPIAARPPRPSSFSLSPVKGSTDGSLPLTSVPYVSASVQTEDVGEGNIQVKRENELDAIVMTTSHSPSDNENPTLHFGSHHITSELSISKSDRANDSCKIVPTTEATNDFDYEEYVGQWENLYAQAQEQLASEVYAKEDAQRTVLFLQEQVAALRAEDDHEKELVAELIALAHSSTRVQSETMAALESNVASIVAQERTPAGDIGNSTTSMSLSSTRRRGSFISRRHSLASPGGSLESTSTTAASSLIVEGSRQAKSTRGRKHTYLLDASKSESTIDSGNEVSKRPGKKFAFSSNITQLSFGAENDTLKSSDSEDDGVASPTSSKIDAEMPVLPDMNFTAILEEIELQEKESVCDVTTSKNTALEAAMSAKIPKSGRFSTSKGPDYSSSRIGAGVPMSISNDSNQLRVVNEGDPMDYIWQYICQQGESPTASTDSSNVRVAIRMRPLNQRELDLHAVQCVRMTTGMDLTIEDEETTAENKFSFDYCFDAACSDTSQPFAGNQQQVFDNLGLEVLTNAWNGYNASLFAYGQTGSGKSYSMMGSDADPGIIPRVCMALFYLIQRHYENVEGEVEAGIKTNPSDRQFSVEASYLEIYNERIRDLLDPSRTNLKVREHPQTGVFVENLSTCAVENYKDVSDLLEMGLEQRTTATTNMNSESSRSHSVFTIVIRMQSLLSSGKKAVRLCKLCLVDLAGSERAASTGATGARLKEGANINKSLSTLGRCISALAKVASAEREGDKISIPFRESVLTWLLRESLCGNAKTAMLATVSPADVNYGETMSTLRYANSAKMIATKAIVNDDPTTKIINELRNEVLRLREELGNSISSTVSRSGPGDGSASSKKLNEKMKEHLLMAEDALQTYAKAWESKELSMQNVKTKLQKRRAAGGIATTSFGVGNMSQEQVSETPYLVSLSGDPMLHLAVKVYIPTSSTLRIGRGEQPVEQSSDGVSIDNDLQLEGLGIEPVHCSVRHCQVSGRVLLEVAPGAACYVNGAQVLPHFSSGEMEQDRRGKSGAEIKGSAVPATVALRGGDRVVLGVCSHVFAFIDPRCDIDDVSLGRGELSTQIRIGESKSLAEGLKRSIKAQEGLASHDQAVREVILGRVETQHEKEVRLATMIANLWSAPAYRRLFEDRLVECLKSVREASTISSMMCATSGIFFETTLGSTVDATALHSLKIRDLFAYSNVTIRVRCCCLVSPYDKLSSDDLNVNEMDHNLPTSVSTLFGKQIDEESPSIDIEASISAGPTGGGCNAKRIARHSRVGSQRSGIGLPSASQVHQLRQVKRNSASLPGDGGGLPFRRPSLHKDKSNVTLLMDKWHTEEAVLLFEANLDDFEDGMGLLRGLFSATGSLRACLLNMREHPLQPRHWDDEFTVFPCSLRNLLCASAHIVSSVLGEDEVQSLVSQVKDAFGGHSSEIDCIAAAQSAALANIAEVLTNLELNGDLVEEMFGYYIHHYAEPNDERGTMDQGLQRVYALLDSLEACLHEGVVACFSSPALLIHPIPSSISRSNSENSLCEEDKIDLINYSESILGKKDDRLLDLRENSTKVETSLLDVIAALQGVKAKKKSLFTMRPEDIQQDISQDPYAYDYELSYEFNNNADKGDVETNNSASDHFQQLTDDEQQHNEWQLQHQECWDGEATYWDDAVDWVRYYDDDSEKYFYYSEALQESRWEG